MDKKLERIGILIQAGRMYSQDVGIGFGKERCAMRMRRGNRHMMKGREQPNKEKSRTARGKETKKYLKIMEGDTIKQAEVKEKEYQENGTTTRNQTI